MSVVAEVPGFFQILSNGSIKMFPPPIATPSSEFSNGYKSKDVTIDASKPITARIFVPDTQNSTAPIPILVYFHGGGFCMGSTTWAGYHDFLGGLCVRSRSVIVSVDYRLAPEHRLPTAYEDCYDSLLWLSRNVGSDPWLKQADLSRVFLSGDSAGGNITHHVALKSLREGLERPTIRGLLVIHPYFGSERRIESEMGDEAAQGVKMNDSFWELSLPEGSDRDHYACNFETAELLPEVNWTQFPSVVVFVAGLDSLKLRGVMYEEFLRKKRVKDVELVVTEGEQHVFHVFRPHSEAARRLQDQMTEFMTRF